MQTSNAKMLQDVKQNWPNLLSLCAMPVFYINLKIKHLKLNFGEKLATSTKSRRCLQNLYLIFEPNNNSIYVT